MHMKVNKTCTKPLRMSYKQAKDKSINFIFVTTGGYSSNEIKLFSTYAPDGDLKSGRSMATAMNVFFMLLFGT